MSDEYNQCMPDEFDAEFYNTHFNRLIEKKFKMPLQPTRASHPNQDLAPSLDAAVKRLEPQTPKNTSDIPDEGVCPNMFLSSGGRETYSSTQSSTQVPQKEVQSGNPVGYVCLITTVLLLLGYAYQVVSSKK